VSAKELARPIDRVRWMRQHRSPSEVAVQVDGKVQGRGVLRRQS
jgi:hypothetical protein